MSTSTVKTVKRGPGRPKKSEYDANGNLKPKIVAVKAIPEVKKDKLTLPIVVRTGQSLNISIKKPDDKNYYPMVGGTFYSSPTNNCQLASVASFNGTLSIVNSQEGLIHVLKCFSQCVGKRILLLDLKTAERDKLKRLLEGTSMIIAETPYTSTNGSHMTIFLIKVWNNVEMMYMANMKKIQDKQV